MSTTDRFAKMTQDQFDGILEGLIGGMTAAQILAVTGAYEVFAEELNNDVLMVWEQDNPEDDDDETPDAPQIGDLVFDPEYTGIALQSAIFYVAEVHGQDPDDDQVWIVNSGTRIVYEDSAWFLAYDKEV